MTTEEHTALDAAVAAGLELPKCVVCRGNACVEYLCIACDDGNDHDPDRIIGQVKRAMGTAYRGTLMDQHQVANDDWSVAFFPPDCGAVWMRGSTELLAMLRAYCAWREETR